MFWNFWKRKSAKEVPPKTKVEKLTRPQNLPQAVGRDIIVELGKDPDWVATFSHYGKLALWAPQWIKYSNSEARP